MVARCTGVGEDPRDSKHAPCAASLKASLAHLGMDVRHVPTVFSSTRTWEADKRDLVRKHGLDWELLSSMSLEEDIPVQGLVLKIGWGERGCSLAHMAAWKRVIDRDLPAALVLEPVRPPSPARALTPARLPSCQPVMCLPPACP